MNPSGSSSPIPAAHPASPRRDGAPGADLPAAGGVPALATGPGPRIADVTARLFTWPITPGADHDGRARDAEVELAVVTVRSDDGAEGHSFVGAHRLGGGRWAADLIQYLKPVVIGANALDLGRHWREMWKRSEFLMMPVIAALDIALWDLAGKLLGQPVHRLLGSCRDRVPAYASSDPVMPVERYAEEVVRYRELGWQAYKVHPHKEPRTDIAICRAVRDAAGPGMVLMLDSMWAYGFEDAVRVGRAIEDLDYFWYEDPLPRDDVYNSAKLCAALDIPVMSVELAHGGLYGLAHYLTARATDILRGDAVLKGGITPLIKIVHLAEAFNMKCEIHTAGNSLNNVANLHVTMAAPNCDYFEVLLPHDLDGFGLTESIEVDRQGLVHAPQRPGLGFDVDWELVERRTVSVLT
jgi:L-alanine-DL-glutamate epimerase-like enolase superfamily enzyme